MKQNNSNLIKPIEASKMIGFAYPRSLPQALKKSLIEHFSDDNIYIQKDRVIDFLNNHTSLINLRDEVLSFYNIKQNSFETRYRESLNKIGIKVTVISNNAHFSYISNKDYEKAIEYYKMLAKSSDCRIITKEEFARKLNLPQDRNIINQIFKTYNISPYIQIERRSWFHLNQISQLLKEQQIEIQRMDDYISIEDLTNQLGYSKSSVLLWIKRNNVKSISPPPIAKVKNDEVDYTGGKKYIRKRFANQYFEMVEFREKLDKVFEYYNADLDPYTTYKELLKIYNYQFQDFAKITNDYWDMFVREKLNDTVRREMEHLVHQFALLTGFLMNIVNHSGKELFQFSTKEINLALLNDNVQYTYKIQYYSFINKIHQGIEKSGGESMFEMENLRSPKKERKKNHKAKEKEIYKPNIYVELSKYCSDVDFHIRKAIADAKNWDSKEYNYYANMWLYVLLQLTNSWRHSDVVDFPRLNMYGDKDLDWLLANPISEQDVKIITAYFENNVYIHNKNQQDRYLIVSDDLRKSFATAVLICEFIQRMKNDLSETIFDFGNKNNQPSDTVHKVFFKGFSYRDFKFENRKMNWTVMTLATDVISKITGRNPLEIAKFLRNHSDEEMTNIYIQLPKEYVEFIANQLFNLGSFGYIYDGMATLLFDEVPKPLQNDNALMIKKTFHNPTVVEGISKHLNGVNKEKNYVINTLRYVSKEEIKEKIDYLNLGLMPSKKEGYQCLLGGAQFCPKKIVACDKCSFNVPNRFALCSLSYDLEKAIDEVELGFESTNLEAEKVRLASGLFTQLSLLRTAIEKFDREVVNQFIPGGLDRINERLSQLPATRSMVSSGVKSWLIEEGIKTV